MAYEQKVGGGGNPPLMPPLAGGIGVGKQSQVQSLGPQGAPVQAKAGPSPATPNPATEQAGGTQTDVADGSRGQLSELLATPARPLGDPVVLYLLGLPLPIMLDELADAARCGYFLQLETRLAAAPPVLFAALQSARLSLYTSLTPAHPALQRTGDALDRVSTEQQVAILGWMLNQRGVHINATNLVEGAIAMKSGEQADQQASDGASDPPQGAGDGASAGGDGAAAGVLVSGSGMPAPIEKGPWTRPRESPQPPQLYVGSDVHAGIEGHYRRVHAGQNVAANTVSIGAILAMFERTKLGKGNPSVLDDGELLLRPDILNLDLKHVYEIKPEAGHAQAKAKVMRYSSVMGKAGIAVELGPTSDPGANGQLPAPDGTVMFECIEPGVILYRYRKSRLVPVPVAAPQRARSRSGARKWKWAFENDLTPDQRAAIVTTTLGGAMLILLFVALAPTGA